MSSTTRWAAVGGLLAAAMLLSACAAGGTSGQSPASASGAATSTGGGHSVMLGTTKAGKVLVDPRGMTLYAFAKDTKGHSVCTGQCAAYWPPVPSSDAPKGASGAVTATFGAIKRTDGSSQLTVNGYPMYTYAGDSQPGQANGQGLNLSGGLWWVVSGSGSWVTH
jgi:predicted lipoprotein with Yx(FWY)xxD motif